MRKLWCQRVCPLSFGMQSHCSSLALHIYCTNGVLKTVYHAAGVFELGKTVSKPNPFLVFLSARGISEAWLK